MYKQDFSPFVNHHKLYLSMEEISQSLPYRFSQQLKISNKCLFALFIFNVG